MLNDKDLLSHLVSHSLVLLARRGGGGDSEMSTCLCLLRTGVEGIGRHITARAGVGFSNRPRVARTHYVVQTALKLEAALLRLEIADVHPLI